MTATARLTAAEMAVLHAAWRNRENYQPPQGAGPIAGSLHERGLLARDPAWPDVTVLTDAGEDAYRAEIDALTLEHGDDWVDRHYR